MLENNVRIIKHKIGLLNLAEELGNVAKACKTMGLSRDTFYRYKAAVETGGCNFLHYLAWIFRNYLAYRILPICTQRTGYR